MRKVKVNNLFGLGISIPILTLWLDSTFKLKFNSMMNLSMFILGSTLPLFIFYYGKKRNYSFTHLSVIALIVLGLMYKIVGVGYVFSGFLYVIPVFWCGVLIFSRESRGGLAVLTMTLGYAIIIVSHVSLSIAPAELLGLASVAILETCFRALLGPTTPLTRVYLSNPTIYLLYSISAISTILYLMDVYEKKPSIILREASISIVYASLITGVFLTFVHYLLPLKHSIIVYPTVLAAILSYFVFNRLRKPI